MLNVSRETFSIFVFLPSQRLFQKTGHFRNVSRETYWFLPKKERADLLFRALYIQKSCLSNRCAFFDLAELKVGIDHGDD